MKRIVFFAVFVGLLSVAASQTATDSIWRDDVRTVSLTRDGIDLEAPVLSVGGSSRLMLRFDVLSAEPEELRYRIAHCDRNWQPDGMEPIEFMMGFEEGSIDNLQYSFTTNIDYVNYWQSIPSEFDKFTASGNYVLTVFAYDNPDSVLLTRRFWVSEAAAKVNVSVDKVTAAEGVMQNQEVNVTVESDMMCQPQYLTVRVRQNGRIDNEHTLQFSGYDRNALSFSHRRENVFPGGNAFRYFDISNLNTPMYNVQQIERYGGETFALLKPLEDRSRRPLSSDRVLNGGMKVSVWDRNNKLTEADYAWVNFSLPMAQPMLGGSIHIVGALTDWALDDRSRMEWNPRYKAYTARMYLKQGYYSYQLIYKPVNEREGLTSVLEGDHFAAPNRYTVFVYMRLPSDRYDRLIAVK